MERKLRMKPLFAFVGLAYAILWQIDLIAPLIIPLIGKGIIFVFYLRLSGFAPFFAAVFVIWKFGSADETQHYKEKLRNFRIHPKWYALAILIPFSTYFVLRLIDNAAGNTSSLVEISLLNLGFALTLSILLSGIQEEPGWRGYLDSKLNENFSSITTSTIVGIIWAFWHFPMYLFGSRPLEQFPQFVLTLIALSVIYSWLLIQTKSVPVVILLHIMHNLAVFTLLDLEKNITFWNGGGLVYSVIAGVIVFLYGTNLRSYRFASP